MEAKSRVGTKKTKKTEGKNQTFFSLYQDQILAILTAHKVKPKKGLIEDLSTLTLSAHSHAMTYAMTRRGH